MAEDEEKLKLQNKLIRLIYYDADGYGSIQNTFGKAKMIDSTLTYETVKNRYAKNLIKKTIIGIITHSLRITPSKNTKWM